MSLEVARCVISRRRSISVVFGAKRTLNRIHGLRSRGSRGVGDQGVDLMLLQRALAQQLLGGAVDHGPIALHQFLGGRGEVREDDGVGLAG
jgi:hypothetical protein